MAFPAKRPVLINDSLSRHLIQLRERTYSQNELTQLAGLFKISCSYNACIYGTVIQILEAHVYLSVLEMEITLHSSLRSLLCIINHVL